MRPASRRQRWNANSEGSRECVLRGVLGHPLVAGQYECQTKHLPVLAAVEVVERQRLATASAGGSTAAGDSPRTSTAGSAAAAIASTEGTAAAAAAWLSINE